jgi:hypothetical protein
MLPQYYNKYKYLLYVCAVLLVCTTNTMKSFHKTNANFGRIKGSTDWWCWRLAS